VNAAFMSLELHERGIHALRSGAGGAGVTKVRSDVCAGAHATNKPSGMLPELHERGIHAVSHTRNAGGPRGRMGLSRSLILFHGVG
jgi:hypothetical protein